MVAKRHSACTNPFLLSGTKAVKARAKHHVQGWRRRAGIRRSVSPQPGTTPLARSGVPASPAPALTPPRCRCARNPSSVRGGRAARLLRPALRLGSHGAAHQADLGEEWKRQDCEDTSARGASYESRPLFMWKVGGVSALPSPPSIPTYGPAPPLALSLVLPLT